MCSSAVTQGSPHTDINKTNMHLESTGCSFSNTSCDGEVLGESESPRENKTQVSATSVDVCTNPTDSKLSRPSMFGVRLLGESPCVFVSVDSLVFFGELFFIDILRYHHLHLILSHHNFD